MADGVFDPNFWPLVKQYVIDSGIEPLTMGEDQNHIWQKIYSAMAANGLAVSPQMSRAALLSMLSFAIFSAGGAFGIFLNGEPVLLNNEPVILRG